MSDYKNALDSYKKSTGKKTENSGFSAGKIPPRDKKNKDVNNSLPEHLKRSLSDSDDSKKTVRNSRIPSSDSSSGMKTDDNGMSAAEKYASQSVPDSEKGEGEKFLSALKKIKVKSNGLKMKN